MRKLWLEQGWDLGERCWGGLGELGGSAATLCCEVEKGEASLGVWEAWGKRRRRI